MRGQHRRERPVGVRCIVRKRSIEGSEHGNEIIGPDIRPDDLQRNGRTAIGFVGGKQLIELDAIARPDFQDECTAVHCQRQVIHLDAATQRQGHRFANIDGVGAIAGIVGNHIVGAPAIHIIAPFAASHETHATVAIEIVVSLRCIEHIIAFPILYVIVPCASVEEIVARIALDVIAAVAPQENIVACVAVDFIVSRHPVKRIVFRGARQYVSMAGRLQRRYPLRQLLGIPLRAVCKANTFHLVAVVVKPVP